MRTLHEALGFQLQLDACKHEVMIAASVGTWKGSCFCFVDVGLEALRCWDEAYLVVKLLARVMPGGCSRQLVGMKRWQGQVCDSLQTLGLCILCCLSL